MKIGIIGAGNIGSTLARKLSAQGHTIKLAASRGVDELRDHAERVGAEAVTPVDAVKGADVVVLSIPFAKNPDLAHVFAGVPADVVVIDTSNYYPKRDGRIDEVEAGKPESVWSSEQFGRPVIKAFNAILADVFDKEGRPSGSADRIAIPVAGDDAHAKAVAMKLVDATGFDAVDAGGLAGSWRQHPGTPAYCTSLTSAELPEALAAADPAKAPAHRDEVMERLGDHATWPSTAAVTALNREVYSRL